MVEHENNPEQLVAAIERLSALDFLTNQDKASIILVSQELKPTALVEMYYLDNTPGYSEENFIHNTEQLKQTLQELRLNVETKAGSEDQNSYELFYIGRTQEAIENLIHATQIVDKIEKDVAMGKSLGIPDTAIEAFTHNQTIKLNELPEDAAKEFKLANFLPSQDHWQEELEFIKQQNEVLQKLSPRLITK